MVGTPTGVLDVLKSGEHFDHVCCGITEWPDEDFQHMVKTLPDVPVVVSSGTRDAAFMGNAYQMGVYDFLLRPFEREQFERAKRLFVDTNAGSDAG